MFRSGDILIKDKFGWVFFRDRAGDTFRWKGENVSTMEVEAIISQVLGERDCVVFGVEIPGTEGRAGMAVIQGAETVLEPGQLFTKLSDKLPTYARPMFVRFVKELSKTGEFGPGGPEIDSVHWLGSFTQFDTLSMYNIQCNSERGRGMK